MKLLAAALVLAIAGALAVARVLAPAETVTVAGEPYPTVQPAAPGITGELLRAPLLVDGRLRVYAAKRHVWADAAIGARTETTPYWSLRRWPAELVGVVAVPGPLVVSKWSDGVLVATDARTGRPQWRVRSPVGARHYAGGRTGASTVYEPPDVHTGRTTDGRTVVVSTGARQTAAFDAATGSPLWTSDGGCEGFTGPGVYAGCGRYDLATGERQPDLPTGRPIGCTVGRSDCTALDTGWILDYGVPVRAEPGAWRVGDVALAADGSAGRALPSGAPLWTRLAEGRIVAVEPGAAYLVTEGRTLVVLDPATGRELNRMSLERAGVRTPPWTPLRVHARDRWLVVERRDGPLRPVLVAGT